MCREEDLPTTPNMDHYKLWRPKPTEERQPRMDDLRALLIEVAQNYLDDRKRIFRIVEYDVQTIVEAAL